MSPILPASRSGELLTGKIAAKRNMSQFFITKELRDSDWNAVLRYDWEGAHDVDDAIVGRICAVHYGSKHVQQVSEFLSLLDDISTSASQHYCKRPILLAQKVYSKLGIDLCCFDQRSCL